ncbi:carboxypeptidase-like regulatory domain-containing protein [Microbulbifer aggregans]|uniref:carboxypeptidase-like regulatory domain-containing protein n=1 Tax=Microbulbifer aggregans TaxID=1769779 RepID=UPI001CFC499F|nr:carboxypeptidase-like regulatory domain-containing protein [Microbulbifer aggregans]
MQHRDSSSDEQNYIQPADFSFATDANADGENTRRASSSGGTLAPDRQRLIQGVVAAVMLAGLVGVFWILPKTVEKPRVVAAPPSTTSTADKAAKASPVNESPFTEAEITQQRREVQKVLQEILQLQEELIERKVETWAAEDYFAARSLAEEADGIYRQRKFHQALEQYRQVLAGLQTLRDSIPERIEQHIAEGNEALNTGDAPGALKAFELVLTISEGHPRGLSGKGRAEILPEVWQHFTNGRDAFSANDLDTAKSALDQALNKDAETLPAKELLPKVEAAILERDYSEAMSAGYAAIGEGKFEQAKQFFSTARTLKPDAADPGIGIAQAENGIAQARIDQLFASATRQEKQEQWHKAAENYRKLIAKDSSLVQALTGKARSEARAKLDDQLQELLQDPLSLGQSKRNHYARKVLADARALNADTPRLNNQIEQLETAITQSLIPITVRLQSDTSTDVTIYHVGKLGNFSEREIALKPGRYTVVGTRSGYRDVRQEIVVDPAGETPVVTIQCAEKINGANNS